MSEPGLAAAVSAAGTPVDVLSVERAAGKETRFWELDVVAADLLGAALGGEPIATITESRDGARPTDSVHIGPMSASQRSFVENRFALAIQQARGAWFLPERITLKTGSLNLLSYLQRFPAHAFTVADTDTARVQVADNPDALFTWAVLLPLLDTVTAPLTMRANTPTGDPDDLRARWTAIEDSYARLGIHVGDALTPFRSAADWGRLTRAEQQDARANLCMGLREQNAASIVARFRAEQVHSLAAAFVKKTKGESPLARRVLTRALQPVLAAYFGGDWLELLDYLDVPPNPGEEIVAALPEARFFLGGASRAAAVAAEHGLELDEVHAMLAAYLGQSTSVSPVDQRVAVMQSWWEQFDTVHARQKPGMWPLWGLVDEGIYAAGNDANRRMPIPRMYRQLLTPDLVQDVDRLWDGLTLPRWPERTVSEPHPHRLMAEAFGPALTFWNGVALTSWYVSEGPYSRTDLAGLAHYHRRHLAELAELATPIDPRMFDELRAAESHLGEPMRVGETARTLPIAGGTGTMTFQGGGWDRRDGFETVRDIVTRYRQAWATAHLDSYLRTRWHNELTTTAHEFHRFVAAKAKPPTLKQFAKFAALAANHWFGGDLTGLYAALGEKAPAQPERVDLLPVDAHEFVAAVYAALGGRPYDDDLVTTDPDAYRRFWALSRLAAASVYYVQTSEALGRQPGPAEFNAKRYNWPWPSGVDEGWPVYSDVVNRLLATPAVQFKPVSELRTAQTSSLATDRRVPAHSPLTPEVAAAAATTAATLASLRPASSPISTMPTNSTRTTARPIEAPPTVAFSRPTANPPPRLTPVRPGDRHEASPRTVPLPRTQSLGSHPAVAVPRRRADSIPDSAIARRRGHFNSGHAPLRASSKNSHKTSTARKVVRTVIALTLVVIGGILGLASILAAAGGYRGIGLIIVLLLAAAAGVPGVRLLRSERGN